MTEAQFEELVHAALRLSPIEKVRLVERVVSTLEDDLSDKKKLPLKSVYGLWAGHSIDISAEDIDEARVEMWGNFPREDI